MKEVRKVCQESSGNATLSVKNYLRAALLFKNSSQKFRVNVSLVCEKFLIFRLKILELSLIK
jgi:hypothetical protein